MKFLRTYFEFTKGERNASTILLLALLASAVWPYVLKPEPPKPSDFSLFQSVASDSALFASDYPSDLANAEYFEFDPNTATQDELLRLGFKSYLAERLIRFRSSGGKFYKAQDLLKLYGMDTVHHTALLPFIRISGSNLQSSKKHERGFVQEKFKKYLIRIEINSADTERLKSLPGIGSKLAARVVGFREKLGGFYSLEQLNEVYGLKPETIQMIKPKLHIDTALVLKLEINRCSADILGKHPYIGFKNGYLLVNYRKQHGDFRDFQAVLKALNAVPIKNENMKYYIIYK